MGGGGGWKPISQCKANERYIQNSWYHVTTHLPMAADANSSCQDTLFKACCLSVLFYQDCYVKKTSLATNRYILLKNCSKDNTTNRVKIFKPL